MQPLMAARVPTRKRPKSRLRKGRPRNPAIGLGLMLTRAEIAKLKALAASDLRSGNSYVDWLVAQELSQPAPKRTASSVRGARASDRRVALKVNLSMPPEVRDELVARAGAEMRSVSGLVSLVVVETSARK